MELVYEDCLDENGEPYRRYLEYDFLLKDSEWDKISAHLPSPQPDDAKTIISECIGLYRELSSNGPEQCPAAALNLEQVLESERESLRLLRETFSDPDLFLALKTGLIGQLQATEEEIAATKAYLQKKIGEKRKFVDYLTALTRRVSRARSRPREREWLRAVVSYLDENWERWTGQRLRNSKTDLGYQLAHTVCSTAAGQHDAAFKRRVSDVISAVGKTDPHFMFGWDDLFPLMKPGAPLHSRQRGRHVWIRPDCITTITLYPDGSAKKITRPIEDWENSST
jgi:hypothetical protein